MAITISEIVQKLQIIDQYLFDGDREKAHYFLAKLIKLLQK